jgi:single-strand DNA-binding protein
MARITLKGTIATTPRFVVASDGSSVNSFRFTEDYDTPDSVVESTANWFTIVAYNTLATQIENEFERGQQVVLSGNLRIREWNNGIRNGTAIEVAIDAIGAID